MLHTAASNSASSKIHFSKFTTSFTNLKKDFEIKNCNYVDNTISFSGTNADNPALILIRTYSVNITNFCFLRTSYEGTMEHNKFKIIGVNDGYDHRTNKNMLFNCFSDFESDAIVSKKFHLVDSVNINDLDNRLINQSKLF